MAKLNGIPCTVIERTDEQPIQINLDFLFCIKREPSTALTRRLFFGVRASDRRARRRWQNVISAMFSRIMERRDEDRNLIPGDNAAAEPSALLSSAELYHQSNKSS